MTEILQIIAALYGLLCLLLLMFPIGEPRAKRRGIWSVLRVCDKRELVEEVEEL